MQKLLQHNQWNTKKEAKVEDKVQNLQIPQSNYYLTDVNNHRIQRISSDVHNK